MQVEAAGDAERKVYSVGGFNRGIASYLQRVPTVWVEGEVTELRRHDRWASVFFTLKDPAEGATLPASMPRGRFDALQLDLVDGERVHVMGRPELFEQRGDFRFRALSIERFGLGALSPRSTLARGYAIVRARARATSARGRAAPRAR
jgi:exodeoxyribonuclease VII large subunit